MLLINIDVYTLMPIIIKSVHVNVALLIICTLLSCVISCVHVNTSVLINCVNVFYSYRHKM